MWSNRELSRTCPVGLLHPSSQWFGEVRCGRTAPNSVEPALSARFPLHHSGLGRFGVVEPPRTQSNLPCRPAYLHHSGSGRFGVVEPRTQSNLPCRPASPFITVVRGGSVWSNRPELTRICPVGLLPPSSQCFGEVRCGRTAPNSLEPQASNLPCRHASPFITVVWEGSVWSNRPELTRTCPVGKLHLVTSVTM